MQDNGIEFGVVVVLLLLMLAIGAATKKLSSNTDDFFRSGCKGTWWLVGMGAFMSSVSAFTFTGIGGMAYYVGWSILGFYIGGFIGLTFHILFLAAWFRQLRVTTFPEAVLLRYGPLTQQVFAVIGIFMFLVGAAVWLLGLAFFSSAVFGIPVMVLIPALGLTALLYSTMGGRWAVMATDFIQGLILVIMAGTLTLLCLAHAGGVGAFLSAIAERELVDDFSFLKDADSRPDGQFSWKWILAIGALQAMQMSSLLQSSRYFSVKDGREARKAAILTMVLLGGCLLFWFIPPMTARIFFEPLVEGVALPKPQEAAYAISSLQLLPTGLVGMMVFAMFAATMSSLDTGLNGNAALVIRNILPAIFRWFRRSQPAELQLLLWSRYLTMGFGLLITALAMYLATLDGLGIFDIALNISSMLIMPMAIPLLLGLLFRRAPRWSCLFTFAAALVPASSAFIVPGLLSLESRICLTLGVGFGAFFLSLAFPEKPERQIRIDQFLFNMKRPVKFLDEVGEGNDSAQMRIMSNFTFAVAGVVFSLLIVPNPLSDRLIILSVACAFLILGFLFRLKFHHKQ
jgi:Na+/proline symporter